MTDARKPTRDEILAMPAGPEMDRLVAIAVRDDIGEGEHRWGPVVVGDGHSDVACDRCGDVFCVHCEGLGGAGYSFDEPQTGAAAAFTEKRGPCVAEPARYSTSMTWAWPLAEKHCIGVVPLAVDGWVALRGPWNTKWINADEPDGEGEECCGDWVYGDTAPHAICRALLLGVCDG